MKSVWVDEEDVEVLGPEELKNFSLKELQKIRDGQLRVIEYARLGRFDSQWESAVPIDGRSQKEIFYETAQKMIDFLDAEIARKKLS